MRIECKYDEMMPLKEVKKRWHPDNENGHPDEQIRSLAKVIAKIGVRHPIHISKQSGKICGGHGRCLAFSKLGYDEVPIVWENFKDELEEVNYRASDNIGQYAEFNTTEYKLNLEKLGIELEDVDLEEFGIIELGVEAEEERSTDDEKYTRKVESPIYEPQQETQPQVSELYDTEKTVKLFKEIRESSLDGEIKDFLLHAAHRHTKFNYKYIAEYYAHATPEEQNLMENSALVIIDFEKAIEKGFVKMTESFREEFEAQNE